MFEMRQDKKLFSPSEKFFQAINKILVLLSKCLIELLETLCCFFNKILMVSDQNEAKDDRRKYRKPK